MKKMKLDPNDPNDVNKFWKRVSMRDVGKFNRQMEAEYGKFMLHADMTLAQRMQVYDNYTLYVLRGKNAKTWELGKGARIARVRKGLGLKLAAGVVTFLTVFDGAAFAAAVISPSKEAEEAWKNFASLNEALAGQVAEGGSITQDQGRVLTDRFDAYLQAIKMPEEYRQKIVNELTKRVVDLP